jgi:hypothetical protein
MPPQTQPNIQWVDSRVMIRLSRKESGNNAKADVKCFTLGRASEL